MIPLIPLIQKVLDQDPRVVFAYLYGSALEGEEYRDVDVAIYADPESDPFGVTADLKIALSRETDLPPDRFDIQVINRADNLLFLQQVLNGRLLMDRGGEVRGDFIESFSMRYRESEGILSEAF